MKLFWLYALRLPTGSGAEYDQWSHELLAQVDEQYAAWERLYDRIRSNNHRLGTLEMVKYSTKEREQIDIFISNMAQFAPLIRGERGQKIAALHLKTLEAVSLYDDFQTLNVFTSARVSRSRKCEYVVH
ncbi:hypothetical protein EKL30_11160 [Candidimonas sp. SYP-B2681]|uniref:hypothetical protein n=1 Tax=Candidimonas sp. SYP-B2681 TaxID=2497686 RepID=UPI000F898BA8|nr:hypothetical protein [Candidimonas sp. SYP-B2681]RTZ43415.1 hypothetical protein EKL30_11160 [Candidimonas sp. SYP-B2681]